MKKIHRACLMGLLAELLFGGCKTPEEMREQRAAWANESLNRIIYFKDPRGANLCFAQQGDPLGGNFTFTHVDCADIPEGLLVPVRLDK